MNKVLLFVSLLIWAVSFGQTISINGSLHSTNGENTFPIWVEEGTTIQPNSPIKSISIKEFNVIPNSNLLLLHHLCLHSFFHSSIIHAFYTFLVSSLLLFDDPYLLH